MADAHLVTPNRIIFALLVAGALVAGVALLPGDRERVAMLERDGKNQEALALLEARFKAGDRRERTLYQLHTLYEHFGRLGEARQTLELLAQVRPRDANVQRQLAQFYKLVQDQPAYLAALARQIELRYAEQPCRELIGLRRLAGNAEEEQAAIEMCRQRGYRRPEDLIRLAKLQAAGGDLVSAGALLRSVDDGRRLRGERERMLLFGVLIDLGQAAEAVRRGARWARGGGEETLVLALVDQLVVARQYDLAVSLVRQSSSPGDLVSLVIAEVLLARGQTTAAQTYLRGWMATARITNATLAERWVETSLAAGDASLALAGAEAVKLEGLSQESLSSLAEALAASGDWTAFLRIADRLEAETLEENPLLAAAVLSRGPGGAPRTLLAQVPFRELDAWRLALWRRLSRSAQPGPQSALTGSAALEMVRRRPRAGVAPSVAPIVARAKRVKRLRAIRPLTGGAAAGKGAPAATGKGGAAGAPAASGG